MHRAFAVFEAPLGQQDEQDSNRAANGARPRREAARAGRMSSGRQRRKNAFWRSMCDQWRCLTGRTGVGG